MNTERQIALAVFERLQRSFPSLDSALDLEPEHYDLLLRFPRQPGLQFDVELNLQNRDELHLCAGDDFWVEWFPCTTPAAVDKFFAATAGLISGDYRILEHRRGNRLVAGELQRPVNGEWHTVTGWTRLALPWPRKHFTVLRNDPAA